MTKINFISRRLCATFLMFVFGLSIANMASAEVPQGFFTDVTPVLADAAFSDFVMAPSADGLTLYFTSFNRADPPGNEDIFVATRPDMQSAFGNIQSLGTPINTSFQEDVGYISSPDQKTIYFGSNRKGSEGFDLWQASRNSIGEPFDDITNLGAGVNTALEENAPRLTPDGETMVFLRGDPPGTPDRGVDIWMASRSGSEPFGAAEAVIATEYQDWWPSISSDTQTLFFSDWVFDEPRPGGQGNGDIWVSYRPSTGEPFGAVVNLNDMFPGTEVNGPFIDGVPYISPDWPAPGSKLYFVNNKLTGELVADVYQATWVPEPSTMLLVFLSLVALGKFRN